MSLDDLPPELVANVVRFLAIKETFLASYATISTARQTAIEARILETLSISSAGLSNFRSLVCLSPYSHRRAALRGLHSSVILPAYDDKACGRFERPPDMQANDEAFSHAVAGLFSALATRENVGEARPLGLMLQNFYSHMDLQDDGDERSVRHDLHEIGARKDLFGTESGD